jgi:hypothetical protein
MLSMGITLTPNDFKKVASRPNATLMQFALCYGMMPVLALGLGNVFKLDKTLVAGLVLVGSINGGQASNLCTYIARGNVALSVLMTTATTLGAIFMTPLLCKLLLGAVVPVDAAGIAKSTIQVSHIVCTLTTLEVELLKQRTAPFKSTQREPNRALFPLYTGRSLSHLDRHVRQPVLSKLCQENSSICTRCRRRLDLSLGSQCRRPSGRPHSSGRS